MIVRFEDGKPEQFETIGIKGACLGDMARLGLNVPPGFIVSADTGLKITAEGGKIPDELFDEIKSQVSELEKKTGRRFGGENPLLLSVRSGSAVSMPGMMDTIINIGMNNDIVKTMIRQTGDDEFVYDCYRRFLHLFGQVVYGVKPTSFDRELQDILNRAGVFSEDDLDASQMRRLCDNFQRLIRKVAMKDIPSDPMVQLKEAIEGVFQSWTNPRATVFRNLRKIPNHYGTAAIIQVMVFGNLGDESASGVFATRDPIVGTKQLFGEYLLFSQGEDVMSGIRTPKRIYELEGDIFPVYEKLQEVGTILENHYRDVQEIEFTIQEGELFLLQTRQANCTAQGKIKITVDMVKEGMITKEEAVMKVLPESLNQILHNYIDPNVQIRSITRGLPASPGAASGAVVFSVEDSARFHSLKQETILVRPETATEDVAGIETCSGILTEKGGVTSHAAVVARRSGIPCVTGCESIQIDEDKKRFLVGELTVKQGDIITIDGSTGRVFLGTVPMRNTTISPEFEELLQWADEFRRLRIRANADTPDDAQRALEFGAEGIGLCRTEAMFMAADRLPFMRTMILEDDPLERTKLLNQLREIQKKEFNEIFRVLEGKPVTIRLLDPPLHEFLPNTEGLMKEVALARGQGEIGEQLSRKEELLNKVMSHQESNPMLGLRGCRLGIISPEIIEMQVTAIFESASHLIKKGIDVKPEILVPLVGHVRELKWIHDRLTVVADEIIKRNNVKLEYAIGVLIEVPRAALTAGKLAEVADFFSFGTNDLTQTTFAFSRDDAETKFLHHYQDQGILDENPFETLDIEGVGRLLRIAVQDGRETNTELKVGLCGEQGGEPRTIEFCHDIGLDFISCSPYRVPIARLAAAQAALRDRNINA